MDALTIVSFLTGGSLVATVVMANFKKLLSDVSDRWGSLLTQLFLFAICLVVALVMWAFQFLPANILVVASGVFAGAITIYEVLYKAVWQQAIKGGEQTTTV